jgi:class 3 adenylate cyclase/tetratricopeptide (TPR) repeat protein
MRACPACGHGNPEDASFCTKCGSGMHAVCSGCGRQNTPDSSFCAGCGRRLESVAAPDPISYTPQHLADKILRTRETIEGERRVVTVLFSDAVGFTPLSERIGEEEVYGLMQGCLEWMMAAVHKYEGTVTSFTGDGVMALFGAPIAHEDAARRAVAAALDMQKSLEEYADDVHRQHPIECRFRVGLNTGSVVVGKISDNLAMDYTALGDTVNLASRMEEIAEAGTVCLTDSTYRAVSDYFECQPLGSFTIKGKSAPVNAYRAVCERPLVRTRLQAAVERGLTPFVGRDRELATLRGYFEQAKGGRGQVVFLSGDAGLGKSRLLLEFRRSLAEEPVTWIEGRCISYGKRIPYLPIAELVKDSFGVQETDDSATIIRRVEEAAAGWQAHSRVTVPFLRFLLNVDSGDLAIESMDPMARRAGLLDALRALLTEESRESTLVLVVEDLHWIDEKSEDALRAMVDVVASSRILMVLNYRPGYSYSLGERTYFSRIALSHLPPEASAAIAEQVLHVGGLPQNLVQLIISKAEGNPFYIEEVTKSLLESGVLRKTNGSYDLVRSPDQIHVPDTIQEVILSRIDRLEREAREAIQLASVIGREFTVRLLDRISDVGDGLEGFLAELKTLELIYEKAYFPELAYMFKHALTHDVAYSTLLAERRRALHRLVAVAIEELYPERLTEHYEALAHHYYEAQEWQKALDYLVKSGEKATSSYANQDALDYYERAWDVCQKLGNDALPNAAAAAQARGAVNDGLGDAAAAELDYIRMLDVARRLGDRRMEGMALTMCGGAQYWAHRFIDSEGSLKQAIAIGEEGYSDVQAAANAWMGSLLLDTGRIAESVPFNKIADDLVPEMGDPGTTGWWAAYRVLGYSWEARFDDALRMMDHWRPVIQTGLTNDMFGQFAEGVTLGSKGDYQAALYLLGDMLATCDRTGETLFRARALNTVGWIHAELQDHEIAIDWDLRSEEAALAINAPDPEIESNARLLLADSFLALGRLDEAEEYLAKVESVVRNPRPEDALLLWGYSQHFYHSAGELRMARREYEQALSLAAECIELAQSTNRPKNVVKGLRLRGQAQLALGKLDESEKSLYQALELAKAVGNPPQLWKTHVALGDLLRARNRPGEASGSYKEAVRVIEEVAGSLTNEQLRDTFLSSQHVLSIRKLASLQGA